MTRELGAQRAGAGGTRGWGEGQGLRSSQASCARGKYYDAGNPIRHELEEQEAGAELQAERAQGSWARARNSTQETEQGAPTMDGADEPEQAHTQESLTAAMDGAESGRRSSRGREDAELGDDGGLGELESDQPRTKAGRAEREVEGGRETRLPWEMAGRAEIRAPWKLQRFNGGREEIN
jgi:hypothetical protein